MDGFSNKHETKSGTVLTAPFRRLLDGATEGEVITWLRER
jgi:hypothetical protein